MRINTRPAAHFPFSATDGERWSRRPQIRNRLSGLSAACGERSAHYLSGLFSAPVFSALRRFTVLFLAVIFLFPFPVHGSEAGGAVSAANPHASRTAVEILRKGGSAVDAAIAAQMVLNLVEPQASGIGGGAFLLHWDGGAEKLTSFDGRETAPRRADGGLFMDGESPMKWADAATGGRSVGAPGLIAMLHKAHRKHGKLKWKTLFEPAVNLSKNGFAVSPRLYEMTVKHRESAGKYKAARSYFFSASGEPAAPGTVLKNPDFAAVLSEVSRRGPRAFYRGRIGRRLVRRVRNAGGMLSVSDLRRYRAVEREPVCAPYRSFTVCGMGPPTSGGLTVMQILKMLERFDMPSLNPMSAKAAHLFTQAARLAYADRNAHMADPDFHRVPVAKLTDEKYLKERSLLINAKKDMGTASPGIDGCVANAGGGALELPSTTHISVVDGRGNAVSMTSSIEKAFGSGVMSDGFLLNNQLTDFSFSPSGRGGCPVANRVEGGKRPRSSMSPTVVFDGEGKLRLIIGSPGGSRIINYVARTVVAVLDWGLDVQAAVALPHYANRNGKTELEKGAEAERLAPALRRMGHDVVISELTSGLHGIEFVGGEIRGGADPRREGVFLVAD